MITFQAVVAIGIVVTGVLIIRFAGFIAARLTDFYGSYPYTRRLPATQLKLDPRYVRVFGGAWALVGALILVLS